MTLFLHLPMHFKVLALLFIIAVWPPARLNGQTINSKTYSVSDGLANSTVYFTIQDSKGFLWIATSSGVNRFDGKNFETFTTDNGLADNEVLTIYEDSQGRIWFLNFNGRLGYYLRGRFYNPENNEVLKKAHIKASFVSCFEDSKKRLWFGTNQQEIVEIAGTQVNFHSKSDGKMDIANSFIFEDEQNYIWASNIKGFYQLKENTFKKVSTPFIAVSHKSHLYDKQTKKLRFLAREGLIQFANGRFKIERTIPVEPNYNAGHFVIKDKDLWISLANDGLLVVKPDGKSVHHYLKKQIISNLQLDREGNIWVTTLGDGLIILPAHTGNLLQYTETNGLPDNSVYSVIKDHRDAVWMGLKTGYLSTLKNGTINSFDLGIPNLPFNPIKKLVYDPDRNSVWFASSVAIGEVDADDPGKPIRHLTEKNNLDFSPKSFAISKKGKFAFSLASGVYILENKNHPLVFQTAVNLPEQTYFPDRAFKILYDSKERLWFSNVNGLYRYEDKRIDTLAKISPIFSRRVTDIIELPDGNMVIGTYGYGMAILNMAENKITRITLKDGLSSNICRKLAFDGKNIWLTTFKGVDKLEYNTKNKAITTYKTKDGLTSDEVLDIFIDDQKIYLGTSEGLTILPRNETVKKVNPPLFYVTSFKVNGKNYPVESVNSLRYNQNNISVKFTAINFTQAAELYQYQLKKDGPWIQTASNNIEFGSLEPGDYQLSVKARTPGSEWSKPGRIDFVIKPAYWQTWWFSASVFFVISALIILLIILYFKRQRGKEQEKSSVQAKIIALEQQALQAMMNPHFVFNIMNSIQYFINTKDAQAANQVLTGFARLIRTNLEICTKSYISLEEELEYLKLYLSLEKLRFGDKMTYELTVDQEIDTDETMIPSMLLQPFVENAIWHGIMPKDEGGHISIKADLTENLLTVRIIDNGTGIDNSQKNKSNTHISRGMQITRDRIALLNKNSRSKISIFGEQTGASGTRITVKIPV